MEEQILQLIATDRIEMPLSSMDQKLRRSRKSLGSILAESLDKGQKYVGERVYAEFKVEDKERARGMKEAIAEFASEHPKYGSILLGKISEKRVRAEEHVYFGVNAGSRLSADDYIGVMQTLGLTEASARSLYPDLMDISRKLAKKKTDLRSVIVGKYAVDD